MIFLLGSRSICTIWEVGIFSGEVKQEAELVNLNRHLPFKALVVCPFKRKAVQSHNVNKHCAPPINIQFEICGRRKLLLGEDPSKSTATCSHPSQVDEWSMWVLPGCMGEEETYMYSRRTMMRYIIHYTFYVATCSFKP